MNKLLELRRELRKIADPKRAKLFQRYFKTGKGEYGEGDIFLGLTVPVCREVVGEYKDLGLKEIEKLLHSKFHEERLIALLILVAQFSKGSEHVRKKIFDFYLKNTKYTNNWDLVDLSSHEIVGQYLLNKNCFILERLVKSKNIWERRIAVLATFNFIKNNKCDESLRIAEMLLQDEHDLIHKAVGWMLREIGKKDRKREVEFLNKYSKKMPRTMLRYAIEKFPEKLRLSFLKK